MTSSLDNSGNSKNVTWKWLAGALAVIIVALSGAWANSVHSRVSDLEKSFALLVTQEQFNARFDMVQRRMIRIEDKIDSIIEREVKRK